MEKNTKEYIVRATIARNFFFKVYAESPEEAYRQIDNVPESDIKVAVGRYRPLYDEEYAEGFTIDYIKDYLDDDGAYIQRHKYKEVLEIVSELEDKNVFEDSTKLPF